MAIPFINKVELCGRVVKDVTTRKAGEHTIAQFSIAVPRIGKKNEVDYFTIEFWGKQAEFCAKYLKKGSPIIIDGTLQQNKWTTQNNEKKSMVKITGKAIHLLEQRASKEQQQQNNQNITPSENNNNELPNTYEEDDEIVPF